MGSSYISASSGVTVSAALKTMKETSKLLSKTVKATVNPPYNFDR